MTRDPLPDQATQEYLWWQAGTIAECRARDEGLTGDAKQLRDLLEGLARSHPDWTMAALAQSLAQSLARITCPERLRWRFR